MTSPQPTLPPWPLNAWYHAAWSHEVGDKPLARTFLGQQVVLYRSADGAAHALADRCAHRATPLRLGEVTEAGLQCGYHGVTFDGTGRCTLIPGQDAIPEAMRGAQFSPRGTPGDRLDLDGRRRLGRRSQPGCRLSLARRSRQLAAHPRRVRDRMRLPAAHRQPDGPHPHPVHPSQHHRRREPEGPGRGVDGGHPHAARRPLHPLDGGDRAAARPTSREPGSARVCWWTAGRNSNTSPPRRCCSGRERWRWAGAPRTTATSPAVSACGSTTAPRRAPRRVATTSGRR